MTDFSRFESLYRFEGQLRLLTALRIGAQKSSDVSNVDLPIIKDATGTPILPGSSLKGVLRAYTEAMLRTLQASTGFGAAVPVPARAQQKIGARTRRLVNEPMQENQPGFNATTATAPNDIVFTELVQWWKEQWALPGNRLLPVELDALIIAASSVAQQVFGAPWLASKVYVRDSAPLDATRVRPIRRDGVSIDRDRHIAQDGFLYSFEAIPAGTRFSFHMDVENASPEELGVVLLGLRALERGDIRLGGASSRGLGAAQLELDWSKGARWVDGNNADALLDYLASGVMQPLPQAPEAYFDAFRRLIRGE